MSVKAWRWSYWGREQVVNILRVSRNGHEADTGGSLDMGDTETEGDNEEHNSLLDNVSTADSDCHFELDR